MSEGVTLDVTKVICFTSNYEGSSAGYGMITFNGMLTIKFGIMKSKEGDLFVTWPQKPKGGDTAGWNPMVTFEDLGAKNQIQKVILDEFNKRLAISNGGQQNKPSSIKVNVKTEEEVVQNEAPPEEDPTPQPAVRWGNRK